MRSGFSPCGLVVAASLAVASMIGSARAATSLQLDFTQFNGPSTAGWTPVYANFLADTATASVNNINGLGYGFSIDHVACYDNGNTAEPLTRSGFYGFNDDASDHLFTLSGLNAGDSVALYSCAAWDGNGRGAVVVFGNSGATGVQAQTVGDPGTAPTLANLTMIGTEVAGADGTVTGSLNGAGGIGSGTEGQLGGMEFVVTAGVPEPTTLLGTSIIAATGLLARRRRLATAMR